MGFTVGRGERVAMTIIVAFSSEINDVAAFWSSQTDNFRVLIAEGQCNAAFAGTRISVVIQGRDQFLDKVFYILWFNDTSGEAAFLVDIDHVHAGHDSPCLAPIDLIGVIALIVFENIQIA